MAYHLVMRIGIYNDWWLPDLVGGTERSALEISEGLGIFFGAENIVVFTPSNKLSSREEIVNGLRTVRVGTFTLRSKYLAPKYIRFLERGRIFFDVLSPLYIALYFSRQKVDVAVIHNLDRVGAKLPFLLNFIFGIRVIRVIHDLSDSCLNRKRFKNGKVCIKTCLTCRPKLFRYRKVAVNSYSSVICNSRFTMNKLESLGFNPKFIDYGYVAAKSSDSKTVDVPKLSTGDPIQIGFVGRISPEKGIEVIIQALSTINRCSRGLTLVGQGEESYIDTLKSLANSLKVNLNILGFVHDPYGLLSESINLIVVPSLWEETLGRVAFEATSRGFTVAVSDIGGLPESAALSGKDFYVFPAGNVQELARLMDSIFLGTAKPWKGERESRNILEVLIATISN